MNPRQYGDVCYRGRADGNSRPWPETPLDFFAVTADICGIYSPLDTPQGLRRGFVFDGSDVRAWEVSHAC
jgi:hypothetical protein